MVQCVCYTSGTGGDSVTVNELYDYAEAHSVIIDDAFVFDKARAVSLPLGEDLCVIGLHPSLRGGAYRAQLAHEIGHCMTGAFYNEHTPVFTRGQCEHRADKWAVRRLLPKKKLLAAMQDGCVEVWQLADHFDLPDDFIIRAIQIYGEGNQWQR
ncbi:MAG: ImmA/IrrE family metallo-endopeptidase [Clostridia bacterium]|nr:ImmA/IrrE family metallo-endopeptidase [Clostridia bacterium]